MEILSKQISFSDWLRVATLKRTSLCNYNYNNYNQKSRFRMSGKRYGYNTALSGDVFLENTIMIRHSNVSQSYGDDTKKCKMQYPSGNTKFDYSVVAVFQVSLLLVKLEIAVLFSLRFQYPAYKHPVR